MIRKTLAIALLATGLALPLAASAQDQDAAEQKRLDREHLRKDLEAARAELADAARRIAELSRQMAEEAGALAGEQLVSLRELRTTRPIIGIVMAEGEDGQVMIAGVTPNGPAARAGLQAGDVLERINGQAIEGKSATERLGHARELIGDLAQGDPVQLDYRRDGKREQVTLEAEKLDRLMVWAPRAGALEPFRRISERFNLDALDLPDGLAGDADIEREIVLAEDCEEPGRDCARVRIHRALRWSGLNLASVDADLGRYFGVDRGVLVLDPGRALDGLKAGDVILSVEGTPVERPRDVLRALRDVPAQTVVVLQVQRDRQPLSVELTVPEPRAMRFIGAPAPPAPPRPPRPPRPPDAPV